jgi:hypothetical protein
MMQVLRPGDFSNYTPQEIARILVWIYEAGIGQGITSRQRIIRVSLISLLLVLVFDVLLVRPWTRVILFAVLLSMLVLILAALLIILRLPSIKEIRRSDWPVILSPLNDRDMVVSDLCSPTVGIESRIIRAYDWQKLAVLVGRLNSSFDNLEDQVNFWASMRAIQACLSSPKYELKVQFAFLQKDHPLLFVLTRKESLGQMVVEKARWPDKVEDICRERLKDSKILRDFVKQATSTTKGIEVVLNQIDESSKHAVNALRSEANEYNEISEIMMRREQEIQLSVEAVLQQLDNTETAWFEEVRNALQNFTEPVHSQVNEALEKEIRPIRDRYQSQRKKVQQERRFEQQRIERARKTDLNRNQRELQKLTRKKGRLSRKAEKIRTELEGTHRSIRSLHYQRTLLLALESTIQSAETADRKAVEKKIESLESKVDDEHRRLENVEREIELTEAEVRDLRKEGQDLLRDYDSQLEGLTSQMSTEERRITAEEENAVGVKMRPLREARSKLERFENFLETYSHLSRVNYHPDIAFQEAMSHKIKVDALKALVVSITDHLSQLKAEHYSVLTFAQQFILPTVSFIGLRPAPVGLPVWVVYYSSDQKARCAQAIPTYRQENEDVILNAVDWVHLPEEVTMVKGSSIALEQEWRKQWSILKGLYFLDEASWGVLFVAALDQRDQRALLDTIRILLRRYRNQLKGMFVRDN